MGDRHPWFTYIKDGDIFHSKLLVYQRLLLSWICWCWWCWWGKRRAFFGTERTSWIRTGMGFTASLLQWGVSSLKPEEGVVIADNWITI
jgi:hypothetical protein